MKNKKTISIDYIKTQANRFLKESDNDRTLERQHLQAFVQGLLVEVGAYAGFACLTQNQVSEGQTFGMFYEGGKDPVFHDQTRTFFI